MRKFLLLSLPFALFGVILSISVLFSEFSEAFKIPSVQAHTQTVLSSQQYRRIQLKKKHAATVTAVSPTPTQAPTPPQSKTMTAVPSVTPTPTTIVTPVPSPTSLPTPLPQQQQVGTTSVTDYIMNAINEYRRSQGLSEVKTDSYTCGFAKTRAEEISRSFNHDGFRDRINNNSLPYPSYSQVTENIAMTSDYKQVVPMWINSSGHAENMRKDTPYVCVEQSGNYFAYEGWRP